MGGRAGVGKTTFCGVVLRSATARKAHAGNGTNAHNLTNPQIEAVAAFLSHQNSTRYMRYSVELLGFLPF